MVQFSEREQAQYEHIEYLHKRLFAIKSNARNSLVIFVIISLLIYYGTKAITVALAVGWIAAMIKGVADDLKRTIFLTEFNRAMCEFEGDLGLLQEKLDVGKHIGREHAKPFWKKLL